VVRAPFAGVIARRFHNPGDVVEASASDPVLRLIDPSKLQVTAAVPVSALSRVVVGHAAHVREPGHDAAIAAVVMVKPPEIDPAAATAEVRLAFRAPTSLTAGTPVQLEIVGEERRNAIVIPAAALVDDEGDVFVMVAGDDGKAHKFPVSVGLSTRTMVQITSGLKAGDRVIVRGQDGLPEGAPVTIEAP
jgi:RND family efflux transporter MFP subunit